MSSSTQRMNSRKNIKLKNIQYKNNVSGGIAKFITDDADEQEY